IATRPEIVVATEALVAFPARRACRARCQRPAFHVVQAVRLPKRVPIVDDALHVVAVISPGRDRRVRVRVVRLHGAGARTLRGESRYDVRRTRNWLRLALPVTIPVATSMSHREARDGQSKKHSDGKQSSARTHS